jgi:Transglutaminase-like superfamily
MERWAKFLRLRPTDLELLPTAVVLVLFVRLSLSILSFKLVRRMLDDVKRLRWRWLAGSSPEHAVWIVKTVARFVPGATCLTQALVTEILYAFRGDAAQTCFGISRHERRLQAHAWVESGGKVILGAAEDGKFTPLVGRG